MSKNIFNIRKKISQDNLQLDEKEKIDEKQKDIKNEFDYYLTNSNEGKSINNKRYKDLVNIKSKNKKYSKSLYKSVFVISEDYPEQCERFIYDRIKERLKGPKLMKSNDYYFINGLIRKYKPKKLLEIGVCSGAVSAVLINAIMDSKDAFLYSCDLETKHYTHPENEVGVIVKKNFPEFLSKWKLYTGNTTAAFIEEIGPWNRFCIS